MSLAGQIDAKAGVVVSRLNPRICVEHVEVHNPNPDPDSDPGREVFWMPLGGSQSEQLAEVTRGCSASVSHARNTPAKLSAAWY